MKWCAQCFLVLIVPQPFNESNVYEDASIRDACFSNMSQHILLKERYYLERWHYMISALMGNIVQVYRVSATI